MVRNHAQDTKTPEDYLYLTKTDDEAHISFVRWLP